MRGGHLVIGVTDGIQSISGISDLHNYTPENFPHRLTGNCSNLNTENLRVEQFVTDDSKKIVWVLHIPKHLPRKPVLAHKIGWQRLGDSLIPLTKEREDAILNEPIHTIDDWSAGICEGAAITDLSSDAIIQARNYYKNKFPEQSEDVDTWSDIAFLNKAKISIRNKITRTAILLLGKPESEHFLSPAVAKIRWVLKDKDNIEKDYSIFTCPFLINVDEVFRKIRNIKYRYMKSEPISIFPEEIVQYEPYNIREALNNCIAHQDYAMGGHINVIEREDDCLIFTNYGSFIPGSVENVIHSDAPEEYYRNRFLTNAMFNLKMVDTIGSGIRKMFNYQRKRFFPMPDYDLSLNKVKVTLTGKVLDTGYASVLAKNPSLSLEEIMLLDKVQKKKKLSNTEVSYLKNKKLIEGRKPYLFISAKIAQTTGQKANYTRHKAFDKQYYFDLIEKAISEHGSMSRKDIDELLMNKISDVYNTLEKKKIKVNNLISEMRSKGKIRNTGTLKNPVWVLIGSMTNN